MARLASQSAREGEDYLPAKESHRLSLETLPWRQGGSPPVSLASQSHQRSPLRSPAQVEGTQGFLPQPGKDLERPSSTRLKARVPYHGSEQ